MHQPKRQPHTRAKSQPSLDSSYNERDLSVSLRGSNFNRDVPPEAEAGRFSDQKIYKVFVSSTYRDLKDARNLIQQAILKLAGC